MQFTMTGADLTAAMARLQYAETALSRLLGVSRKAVQRWRRGEYPIPPAHALYLTRLLAWHERNPPPPPPPRSGRLPR